ncbi:histidine kinase [Streptomyces sp. UNOC14_S4]|uniref:sensor histidine kinase n=1 Tax=Streptomyces sp. UNOC14_S4 TaxID=2872340 RepID=UPI001E46B301|nr:histidine kinase [Streptomyces sp. UNOC14_S4]MCC3772860.1 two-component sensor histidine kinase [Streptomyces sp. UNOC14_S4]
MPPVSVSVSGLSRTRCWLRTHPLAADVLLAAATFATVLIGAVVNRHGTLPAPGLNFLLLGAVACACLAARRRAPRTVLCATSVLTLVEVVTGRDDPPRTQIAMAVVVALYTVASRTERPATWRIAALTLALLAGIVVLSGAPPWYSQENLGLIAWTGLAAAAGDAVRSRRAYIAAIEERAVRAELTREEEARRRVAEERLRIARELHDVVAHHIALVNVQAGVASHVMDSRPDQAKEALAHVREASRSALAELSATVGLLRQYGDPEAPTEPAPGLAALDQLVDGFARAGLYVAVSTASDAADGPGTGTGAGADRAAAVIGKLPAAVDLTAYRVLQEALTNVHKHAGPGARAEISLERAADGLRLTVLDDGGDPPPEPAPPPGAPGRPAGGHGLLGMRERACALGGTCEAGPRDGAPGFRVSVTLPLAARAGGGSRLG